MGGDINVVSEVGKGSVFTFTVRLPVADPSTPTIAHDFEDSALYGPPPPFTHGPTQELANARSSSCMVGQGRFARGKEGAGGGGQPGQPEGGHQDAQVSRLLRHRTYNPSNQETKGVAVWPVPAKAPELTLHSMPCTMCVAGG